MISVNLVCIGKVLLSFKTDINSFHAGRVAGMIKVHVLNTRLPRTGSNCDVVLIPIQLSYVLKNYI